MYALADILAAPITAVDVEMGVGQGFGGSVSVVYNGVDVSAGAVAAVTDSLYFDESGVQALVTTQANVSVSIGSFISH